VEASSDPGVDEARRTGGASGEFEETLAGLGFTSELTITISDAREVDGDAPALWNGEPAIELTVPQQGDDVRQAVLAVDETGLMSWHFDWDLSRDVAPGPGGGERTYLIRRSTADGQSNERRGLIGRIGRKVIRVLSLRIVGDVAGYLAGRWEHDNRPYSIRRLEPANFFLWDGPPVTPADWGRLSGGRALLFIHGTFSRAGNGFGQMNRVAFEKLYRAYGCRVFAFDHPTISVDPDSNVRAFLGSVPAGRTLDLDIICHSRGGLVARKLAESGAPNVVVQRLLLVAAPSQGTELANIGRLNDLLDALTTIANVVPMPTPWHVLAAALSVVRQLIVAGAYGLDGLACMAPGSPFLIALNGPPSRRRAPLHYAISSDFSPAPGSTALDRLKNLVVDRIHNAPNDLLVTLASAYGPNGSPNFPIPSAARLGYPVTSADHVDHSAYFCQPGTLPWARSVLAAAPPDPNCSPQAKLRSA
jgi:hypothetical protein